MFTALHQVDQFFVCRHETLECSENFFSFLITAVLFNGEINISLISFTVKVFSLKLFVEKCDVEFDIPGLSR